MTINAAVALLVICASALFFLSLSIGFHLHSMRDSRLYYREMFQRNREGMFVIRVGHSGQFFIEEMNGAATAVIPHIQSGQPLASPTNNFTIDHQRFLNDLLGSLRQVVAHGCGREYECSFWHNKEGRLVTYLIRLMPEEGRKPASHVIGFMRDISDQKQIEALLAVRTQDFRALVENSPDTIARYDRECHRIYANPAFKLLVVQAICSVPQREANDYCGAGYRDKLLDVLSSGIDEEFECTWTDANGKQMHSHVRLVAERDRSGQVSGVLSIGRDIATLKETEHHLRESRALLRELTARREMTAERNYRGIARELHEDLGQSLSAIRIKLALLPMRFGHFDPELGQRIGKATALLDHTIAQMREMVSAIHPAVLNMGISTALEWLAADALAATDIEYEIRVASPLDEMDKINTVLIFKIVQQALSNVVQHAAAHYVVISLDKLHGSFQLEVRDDGQGFDLDQPRTHSLGLAEMEELSHRLEGEIVFLSEPGNGTVIEVRFPEKAATQRSSLQTV